MSNKELREKVSKIGLELLECAKKNQIERALEIMQANYEVIYKGYFYLSYDFNDIIFYPYEWAYHLNFKDFCKRYAKKLISIIRIKNIVTRYYSKTKNLLYF